MNRTGYYRFEKVFSPEDNHREPTPAARSGHRAVATNRTLYSIGGYNPDYWGVENDNNSNYPLFKELWKFNLLKRRWTKVNSRGQMPLELASHSALLHGRLMLVYGGTGIPFGTAASNVLNFYNLDTNKWSSLSCTGDLPIRTYGHGMALYGQYLYVFGGTTGWEYNAEMHRLDLQTLSWELLGKKQTSEPAGRYRHEIVCWKGKIFVFGGGRSNAVFGFDQIPVFDMETCSWDFVKPLPGDTEDYPLPRRCHTCSQLKNRVYVCGGYNGEKIFDDLWIFDLDLIQWYLMPQRLPQPVYFHASAITPTGCLLIFGGVDHIEMKRTSAVYSLQVVPPSLKQATWNYMCRTMPHLANKSYGFLREFGVPRELIEQLY